MFQCISFPFIAKIPFIELQVQNFLYAFLDPHVLEDYIRTFYPEGYNAHPL